jgi:hypothetical protein
VAPIGDATEGALCDARGNLHNETN